MLLIVLLFNLIRLNGYCHRVCVCVCVCVCAMRCVLVLVVFGLKEEFN